MVLAPTLILTLILTPNPPQRYLLATTIIIIRLSSCFGRLKITNADWLLKCPKWYDIRPAHNDFYSGLVCFGGKVFREILMKFEEN